MKCSSLTLEQIASFECKPRKSQTLYHDGECPGLAVRVTPAGHKAFVFDSRVRRSDKSIKIRITIGHVKTWTIEDARVIARRYKVLTDLGIDPRKSAHRATDL
jgi:hypothetical protein